MEPIKYISELSGASPDGLRIIFSLFFVYPLSWFYRSYLHDKDSTVKHLFFTFCGISIGAYNFGYDVGHCIFSVLFSYVSMRVLGPTKTNVLVNLFFHMGYLLMGYWFTNSDTYDMTWTMPQCVLCLRLIGFSQDLWDGTKDFDSLSESYKITALRSKPTLLEMFSYVFFPASFLVGPQFSMMRLKNFVTGKLENNSEPTNIYAGSQRGLIGLVYLVGYQVGISYLTEEYFLTEAFLESSFVWKHIILGIWTKIYFMKYVFCWLLTEGACITFGIAYNGKSKDNKALWDGCRNINLLIFEGTTKFGHYVTGFNVNTNTWSAQYVYKRLAFLGNRVISHALTLLFLCVWHGFHSGYYMAFFMEFVTILMEKDLENMMQYSERYAKISQYKAFKVVTYIALKLYANIFMGYAFVPFALFSFDKWWPVYKSLYFSGFIFFFPWSILYRRVALFLLKPNFKSKEKVK